MKALGVILIVAGILMFVFANVTFTTKKKIVEAGPVEINKKEQKTIAWPNYAGAVAVVAGIAVLAISARRRSD